MVVYIYIISVMFKVILLQTVKMNTNAFLVMLPCSMCIFINLMNVILNVFV